METAVAMATLNFNMGAKGILRVMEEMKIPVNERLSSFCEKRVSLSIKASRRKQSGISKWARRQQKIKNIELDHQRRQKEGISYKAGEFAEVSEPAKTSSRKPLRVVKRRRAGWSTSRVNRRGLCKWKRSFAVRRY